MNIGTAIFGHFAEWLVSFRVASEAAGQLSCKWNEVVQSSLQVPEFKRWKKVDCGLICAHRGHARVSSQDSPPKKACPTGAASAYSPALSLSLTFSSLWREPSEESIQGARTANRIDTNQMTRLHPRPKKSRFAKKKNIIDFSSASCIASRRQCWTSMLSQATDRCRPQLTSSIDFET